MTIEEIIDGLEIYTVGRLNKDRVHITVEELQDFIDAIKELQQEPCGDCVSREAVENAIKHAEVNFTVNSDIDFTKHKREVQEIVNGIIDAQIKALRDLPSVTAQPKTGKWKAFTHSAYHGNDEDGEPIWREVTIYHCNLCNRRTVIKEEYCPNCGAKMSEIPTGSERSDNERVCMEKANIIRKRTTYMMK